MQNQPQYQVEDFAVLRVVSMTDVGAFLDWNQPKDLFLPFSEQTQSIAAGDDVVVKIYLDNVGRPCASMRLERHVNKVPPSYKDNEQVELLIASETDLGFKAVINQKHLGLLYKNEIFQPLQIGDFATGFIRKMREDGKIDLILRAPGHKATGDIGEKIIEMLKQNNGFLQIDDKTPPEKIYDLFGVSKKKYKIALGGLYKSKVITIVDHGIQLTK
ncbi:MAG: GntR family transcriptional regulator [Bdellovibrionaceae bacterium]|nr:GntR family transcriptional regulator [Bdellovibrio sp.]